MKTLKLGIAASMHVWSGVTYRQLNLASGGSNEGTSTKQGYLAVGRINTSAALQEGKHVLLRCKTKEAWHLPCS